MTNTKNKPCLDLMKRIGYLQADYDTFQNSDKDVMPDELIQDINAMQTEFNISNNDMKSLLKGELTLVETAMLFE